VNALDRLQSHSGHTGSEINAASNVVTLVKSWCRTEDLVEPRRIELPTFALRNQPSH